MTDHGAVRIETPRDRNGQFEPQLVKKGQRRVAGLDEKIIALYAGGMTTREIERYLGELYGPGVSRDTVSRITAAVLDDAKEWQTRPLEQVYPILYLDALIVKIRDGQAVRNFACYLGIGVNTDGERDVLGMWFQKTEGAKFWLQVLTELKTRGVEDVLVCCVDGLGGFPEAIEAVYPKAWIQTCLVHQIRSSLPFVPYKDRRAVAGDLKKIYTAVDRDHAETMLEAFAETWDPRYPMISASWIEAWERIVPFLAFAPDLRRVVYTTNAIEALNRQVRKIIKTRGSLPAKTQPANSFTSRSQGPNDAGATHLQLEHRSRRPQDPLRRPTPRHRNLTLTTIPPVLPLTCTCTYTAHTDCLRPSSTCPPNQLAQRFRGLDRPGFVGACFCVSVTVGLHRDPRQRSRGFFCTARTPPAYPIGGSRLRRHTG